MNKRKVSPESIISKSTKTSSPRSDAKTYILVTGGAGFIGSNLCRVLLSDDNIVYAVDNLITGYKKNIDDLLGNERFHFFELDITSDNFIQQFQNVHLDKIYHLACPTGVPNIALLGEEMIKTCSNGTFNVMEIAKKHDASVLFTSTAEVYGQPEILPIPEHYNGNVDPIGPRSPYEEGKRFSESILKMYFDKYNVACKIVRVFNTYGPGMSFNDTRIIPQFIKCILTGKKLTVYGDGTQTRTHLFIDDLVYGLILVMKRGNAGEIYNIGGKHQMTVLELAEVLLHCTGRENAIVFKPHFIEDHRKRQPIVNKVQQLGWQQKVSLEVGLLIMILCYVTNYPSNISLDNLELISPQTFMHYMLRLVHSSKSIPLSDLSHVDESLSNVY